MKLSNKVLIGFFGFILIYMITAFTQLRLKGDLNRFDDSSSIIEKKELAAIGHLVVPNLGVDVKISVADQPRIELRSSEGKVLSKLKYEIQGDTLRLLSFDLPDDEHAHVYVYVVRGGLRQLVVNGAKVIINDFNQQVLSVRQSGGILRMQGNNKLEKVSIDASDNANIEGSGFELNTLLLKADHSSIRFYSAVNRLEGVIGNESDLFIKSVNDIQFKKDESSRWRMSY